MTGRRLARGKTGNAVASGKKAFRKSEDTAALSDKQSQAEKLLRPVSSLKLKGLIPQTAGACKSQLEKSGIRTIGDLVRLKEEDLLEKRYLRGEKFRKVLKKELAALGLRLGMGNELDRRQLFYKLGKRIDRAGFSYRAEYNLKHNNLRYIFELVQKTEGDVLLMKGIGRGTLAEVKKGLAGMNLTLGMKLEEETLDSVKRMVKYVPPKPARKKRARAVKKAAAKALQAAATEGEDLSSAVPALAETLGKGIEETPKVEEKATVRQALVLDVDMNLSQLRKLFGDATVRQALVLDGNLNLPQLQELFGNARGELKALSETVRPEVMRYWEKVLGLFRFPPPPESGPRTGQANPGEN